MGQRSPSPWWVPSLVLVPDGHCTPQVSNRPFAQFERKSPNDNSLRGAKEGKSGEDRNEGSPNLPAFKSFALGEG